MNRFGLLAVLVLLAGTASGCSLLVARADSAACQIVDNVDPCPGEQVCRLGMCERCVPSEELCDAVDNDCDGLVDEGHDTDGDGFTWCGGGRQELRDCDDNDPKVHPSSDTVVAAEETCDGKDNNCNGAIDEVNATVAGASLCSDGQVCISTEGCVVPDCTTPGYECATDEQCAVNETPPTCRPGRCTEGSCGAGQICDAATGACVEQRPLGQSCFVDAECQSGSCISIHALRLPGGTGTGVCGKACCSDADCAPDDVCWASGSGARSCLPPAMVSTARGMSEPLASCMTGSECDSGICSSVCLGNCARDENCDATQVCAFTGPLSTTLFSDWVMLSCEPAYGSGSIGDLCVQGNDCASGLCLGSSVGECSQACGGGADCPSTHYCNLAARATLESRAVDYLPACIRKDHAGTAATGQVCSSAGDCRDRRCENGLCADACCHDADCPSGTLCRPIVAGASWEMHCL